MHYLSANILKIFAQFSIKVKLFPKENISNSYKFS